MIAIIVAISILVYSIILITIYDDNYPKTDPLNRILFRIPYVEGCCSAWPLSHFVMFAILGYYFPQCAAPILIWGAIWELLEDLLHVQGLTKTRHTVIMEDGTVQYSKRWWAGDLKDIMFNVVGFYTGKFIRDLI